MPFMTAGHTHVVSLVLPSVDVLIAVALLQSGLPSLSVKTLPLMILRQICAQTRAGAFVAVLPTFVQLVKRRCTGAVQRHHCRSAAAVGLTGAQKTLWA